MTVAVRGGHTRERHLCDGRFVHVGVVCSPVARNVVIRGAAMCRDGASLQKIHSGPNTSTGAFTRSTNPHTDTHTNASSHTQSAAAQQHNRTSDHYGREEALKTAQCTSDYAGTATSFRAQHAGDPDEKQHCLRRSVNGNNYSVHTCRNTCMVCTGGSAS